MRKPITLRANGEQKWPPSPSGEIDPPGTSFRGARQREPQMRNYA